MKSFGAYISKHLVYFAIVILGLLFIDALAFGWTFQKAFTNDYGETSPQNMTEEAAAASALTGISSEMAEKLRDDHIWAMYLNQDGECVWSLDLPSEIPAYYTIQSVAVFSRGYLADYPVFVRSMDDGLLVLGYPKGSYTKIIGNYFSVRTVKTLPVYAAGMLAVDFLLLFLAYFFSKRKIMKNTEPIAASIQSLSKGEPVSLFIHGELSEIADSINRVSQILSRQNEARANWISGVSHDIRTPLSMIMGYAERISHDDMADASVKEQAEIIRRQSIKIKELVQDLNLVSELEYEMQPLSKEPMRPAKLVRSCAAELHNAGISDEYTIDIEITPRAEAVVMECDARLFSRAMNNLVQNSIAHNPQGCKISIFLDYPEKKVQLIVADNGIGISAEKLQELEEKPHYMESMDERLDLRHGLGLLLVRQIAEAHDGTVKIESEPEHGCKITLEMPVGQGS